MKIKILISCLLLSNVAFADDATNSIEPALNVSGSMALLSNYIWRGQSPSFDKPSVQGDIMIDHESGLYIGSSFETYRNGDEDTKDYELDYYGGYYNQLNDDLGIGVMINSYTYGNADSTLEYNITVDYKSFSVGVNYDKDTEAYYSELNYSLTVINEDELTLHAGYFTDAEYYGFGDENYPADNFYDMAIRYDYPVTELFAFHLEASYQEFDHDHYMVGLSYSF